MQSAQQQQEQWYTCHQDPIGSHLHTAANQQQRYAENAPSTQSANQTLFGSLHHNIASSFQKKRSLSAMANNSSSWFYPIIAPLDGAVVSCDVKRATSENAIEIDTIAGGDTLRTMTHNNNTNNSAFPRCKTYETFLQQQQPLHNMNNNNNEKNNNEQRQQYGFSTLGQSLLNTVISADRNALNTSSLNSDTSVKHGEIRFKSVPELEVGKKTTWPNNDVAKWSSNLDLSCNVKEPTEPLQKAMNIPYKYESLFIDTCRYILKCRVDRVFSMHAKWNTHHPVIPSQCVVPKSLATIVNNVGVVNCFGGTVQIVPEPEDEILLSTQSWLSKRIQDQHLRAFSDMITAAAYYSTLEHTPMPLDTINGDSQMGNSYWLMMTRDPALETLHSSPEFQLTSLSQPSPYYSPFPNNPAKTSYSTSNNYPQPISSSSLSQTAYSSPPSVTTSFPIAVNADTVKVYAAIPDSSPRDILLAAIVQNRFNRSIGPNVTLGAPVTVHHAMALRTRFNISGTLEHFDEMLIESE